jgi:hypothetical protein
MTEQEISAVGPAFAAYLRRFHGCFGWDRTAGHFDASGHGPPLRTGSARASGPHGFGASRVGNSTP